MGIRDTVSILGLGVMGLPMARNAEAAGFDLTVWNRSLAKTLEFAGRGTRVATDPAGAAADIVLTVLPDLPDVRAVVEGPCGLLVGWRERGAEAPILVVMGTVSPVALAAYAAELAAEGVRVVDAPLSGGVRGAESGRLSIMLGGESADVRRVLPVCAAMATTVRHLGPVGSGELAKACNQMIVAATVASISEAMVLARSAGLDIASLLEVLSGGLASSEVLAQKREHWLHERFEPGGRADYQLKDLNFVREAARERGVDLVVTEGVRSLFERVVDAGEGGEDHTVVYRTIQRASRA